MIKEILKYFGLVKVENLDVALSQVKKYKLDLLNKDNRINTLERTLSGRTRKLEEKIEEYDKLILSKNTNVEYQKLKMFLESNTKLNKEYNTNGNKGKLKAWAKRIKDIGSCDICDSKDNLSAHHLYDKSTHPTLSFQDENGVCLCVTCHDGFHKKYTCKSQTTPKMYEKYKIIKLNGLQ